MDEEEEEIGDEGSKEESQDMTNGPGNP